MSAFNSLGIDRNFILTGVLHDGLSIEVALLLFGG